MRTEPATFGRLSMQAQGPPDEGEPYESCLRCGGWPCACDPPEYWGGHVVGCEFNTTDGWTCRPECRAGASKDETFSTPSLDTCSCGSSGALDGHDYFCALRWGGKP